MGPSKKHLSSSSERTSDDDDKKGKKRKKGGSSKRKRKYESSDSSSSSDTSSSSDSEERRRKLKKMKKLKRLRKAQDKSAKKPAKEEDKLKSADIPIELMEKSKSMAPMTKEEWDKRQSVVKKVYDESTGRHRLIKGDGEVIEDMVSRDRHKAINQMATRGDGDFFQARLQANLKK